MRVAPNLETRVDRIAVSDVFKIMTQARWAAGRTLEQVGEMMKHTRFMVLATVDGEPVGFARAVSDTVFRAFIEDVIVAPGMQRRGIGRLMMNTLEEMIRNSGIPRIELVTREPGFWNKTGYRAREESTYMIKLMNA